MKHFAIGFGILALLAPLTSKALATGEGIVPDQNTGDYVITYADAVGYLMKSTFVPSTKIDPMLHSGFENQHDLVHYRYSIKNGSQGKQPLIGLIFDSVSNVQGSKDLPVTQQEFIHKARQLENDMVRLEQYVNATGKAFESPEGWSCGVEPNGVITRTNFRVHCSFDDLDEEQHNGL